MYLGIANANMLKGATDKSSGTCFPLGIGFAGGNPALKPGDTCSQSPDGSASLVKTFSDISKITGA